ncbi:guanylate kinase [Salinibacterium sp. G-O1]|uniref:guanylate kinase n=1 Tax=Salinibacterium sp. G-O1 TaxID=3046208 RepID=UPI0024B88977|nr:guanylate kinase [Salinibacterium sp. G-O1]MDJ0335184.1 guanylate kinase [Salinibacterium sp. G-O1]
MSPRPAPPEVDRAAAGRAAIAARRARAAVKQSIASKQKTALAVAQSAWADPDSAEASLRVTELLTSVPTLGPTRVARVMFDLGISDKKRVGGLGVRQRIRLRDYLVHRQGAEPSRLIVLAGPTAVGKGTVSAHIRENYPDVMLSVSATTRTPRPGEIDGIHYYFVSDEEFDRKIADNELLEWAVVHNSYRYGTPRPPIDEALAAGKRVMLEIDLQGARQVRSVMSEALLVFLLPPTWEELVRRLIGRGTEKPEEQQRRLDTARVELAAQDEFDAKVINREVSQAAQEVVELMDAPIGAPISR